MKVNFNVVWLTCDGGSRVVCELANGLVSRGETVSITSLAPLNLGWMDYKPLSKKVEVKVVRPTLLMRMFRKAYLTRNGWNYNLKEVLTQAMPDCDINVAVHSQLAFATLLSGKGKPVHLIQAYEPQTQWYGDPVRARESELSYMLPLKKLCVSQFLAEKVDGFNIGNGVDLDIYKPLHVAKVKGSVMGINTRSRIPWKNGAMLEQVFAELHRRGIPTLSPPRGIRDSEFVQYYRRACVYVFLSWGGYEGFGLQPLEAMACGTPVITSPSVSYASHLENAFVLPKTFTVADVVNAVEKLLNDFELQFKLITNGFATAEKYSFTKVVDNFLKEVQ